MDRKYSKDRRTIDFHPYKRKTYRFRKSKTFKNREKRNKKNRERRYWKKNDSTNRKVPNYRKSKETTNKECWTCGKPGHFAPDCPDKQRKQLRVNIVEDIIPYADLNNLDILYPSKLKEIDEESVLSVTTDTESKTTSEESSVEELRIELNMVEIKE